MLSLVMFFMLTGSSSVVKIFQTYYVIKDDNSVNSNYVLLDARFTDSDNPPLGISCLGEKDYSDNSYGWNVRKVIYDVYYVRSNEISANI